MAFLGVFLAASGQDAHVAGDLDISIEGLEPHYVGLEPQRLLVRVASSSAPVADARLDLELVGAPDSTYCTCGQATTESDGTFEIKWGSLVPGAYTLRITASADEYGQTVDEFVLYATDADTAPSDSSSIDLWIPSSMLEDRVYEGVIITQKAYPHGSKALLTSSDPAIVGVDTEAVLLPGKNHAIFSIYPKTATSKAVSIFASVDGPLISAESRIYSQQSAPSRLHLILPSNRTVADSMMTYVAIVDENGAPARTDHDVKVLLEAESALDLPDFVTIPAKSFYSSFETEVLGSDTLWAHADGLESASAQIRKTPHNATLQIGVAPDPAGANSYAKYHVWLIMDSLPYSPPGVKVGKIHTNNTSVAGFNAAGQLNSESETLYIRNGIANGTIYTRSAGAVSITASLPDVGTATSSIIVGPQLSRGENRVPVPDCSGMQSEAGYDANLIDVRVYPDITSSKASLGIAPYHERVADSECIGDELDRECTGSHNGGGCGLIRYPVEVDNRQVSLSVSPPGVSYDELVELTHHTFRSFFTEFELVVQDVGDYVVDATATNVLPASGSFSSPRNPQQYRLHIVPLLVDAGGSEQDVALISIVDSEGALVDTGRAFGRPTRVSITGQGIEETVTIAGDSARLRAKLDVSTTITATAPNLVRAVSEIPLPRIASHIDLDMPANVHLHEEFPFAIHATDSTGTLIETGQRADLVASGMSIDWESHRMRAGLAGNITMSVLADYGAHQKSVDVFANKLDMNIRESGATARVGAPFRIDVLTSGDIEMSVSTGIPWKRVEGTASIEVTSGVPGTFPVTITASKPGYTPESETVYVTVEDYTLLDITATGTDGTELELTGVLLGLNTRDSESTTSDIVLPWRREYRNLASVEMTFPNSHGAGGGYVFSSVTVNGHSYEQNPVNVAVSGDTKAHTIYERSVMVGVAGDHDVMGTGHHAYDRDVELTAQTKSKFGFLVFEVFDHWENLPDDAVIDGDTVRFRALENTNVTAVYRDDYTGALVTALAAMASLVVLRHYRQRHRTSFLWTLGELYRSARIRLVSYRPAQRRTKKAEPSP